MSNVIDPASEIFNDLPIDVSKQSSCIPIEVGQEPAERVVSSTTMNLPFATTYKLIPQEFRGLRSPPPNRNKPIAEDRNVDLAESREWYLLAASGKAFEFWNSPDEVDYE
jgi:hypothetical protein